MSDTTLITRIRVKGKDLQTLIEDPCRGVFSLVGSSGNLSLITGDPEPSALLGGAITIDTEHGTVLVDADEELLVSEQHANTLTPDTRRPGAHWVVEWTIDEEDAPTPREAAMSVWQSQFGREQAGPDDCCVFTVTDIGTGEHVLFDLAGDLDD